MINVPETAIHTATLPAMNIVWAKMQSYARTTQHPLGNSTYPYGEKDNRFYYISKGMLTIVHCATDGKTRDMICMHTGSLLNVAHVLGSHIASFLDTGYHFYCLNDVELWRFPGKLLQDEEFIRMHPELISNLMESLGVRILLMHNTLSYSMSGDAVTKVARFCFNISQTHDCASVIEHPIQLGKLANLLGIHRISLFRAIKKLRGEGIIVTFSSERLEILDQAQLKHLAMDK